MPTHLTCVKCTSVLDKATVEGVEVDLCPRCGGLWLDQGEAERLAGLPSDGLSPLRRLLEAGGDSEPSEARGPCPACAGALKELVLGPIHVDHCDRCHGLFLDRGELDEAVATLRSSGASVASLLQVAAAAIQ